MDADTIVKQSGGKDKIDVYGWVRNQKEPVIQLIHKTNLNIDWENYQRQYNNSTVTKLARNWDPVCVGILTVAKREDGTYWVVDGQHRLLASLKRSDVEYLSCAVFESKGAVEEAEYFVRLNMSQIKPNVEQRFRARLVYGEPVALKLVEIFNEFGFGWSGHTSGDSNKKKIRCFSTTEKILKKTNGEEILRTSLDLIEPLYSLSTVDSKVLEGVSWIVEHYNIPDIDALRHGLVVVGRDRLVSAYKHADKDSANGDKSSSQSYAEAFLILLKTTRGTGMYTQQRDGKRKTSPLLPTVKKVIKHE